MLPFIDRSIPQMLRNQTVFKSSGEMPFLKKFSVNYLLKLGIQLNYHLKNYTIL